MAYYNRTIRADVKTEADGSVITVGTDAYTSGDVEGGLLKCTYGTSGGALCRQIKVLDKGAYTGAFVLHIYHTEPSAIADDAAFAPTDADGQKEIGYVTVAAGDYNSQTAYAVAHIPAINFDGWSGDVPANRTATADKGAVYIYAVAGAANDHVAATDLEIEMTFWVE